MFRRFIRIAGSLSLALGCAIASPATAQTANDSGLSRSDVYDTRIVPSLAFVLAENGKYGTAFCVGASGAKTYFLTSDHVISDATGKPVKFALYFPDNPTTPVPGVAEKSGSTAPVTGTSTDTLAPDLALISVSVPLPNVKPLRISTITPKSNYPIGISGYPQIQYNNWIATQKRDLGPILGGPGTVAGFNLFGYYIQYSGAVTDEGNSGGPLYDPDSGSFYGIVTQVVGGIYASVQHGMAISGKTIQDFLSGFTAIKLLTYSPPPDVLKKYGAETELTGPENCLNAMLLFSKHFGEWYQWREAMLDAPSADGQARLVALAAGLRDDQRRLEAASNADTAQLALDLVNQVDTFDGASAGARQSGTAQTAFRGAAQRFTDLGTCDASR